MTETNEQTDLDADGGDSTSAQVIEAAAEAPAEGATDAGRRATPPDRRGRPDAEGTGADGGDHSAPRRPSRPPPRRRPRVRDAGETGDDRSSPRGSVADAAAPRPRRPALRLDISYDGTDFSGWAIQPGRRTVAGELHDALATLLREPARLVVAGRTDAGVHATGQVAHVDVAGRRGWPRARAPRTCTVTPRRRRRPAAWGCAAGSPGCCRPTSGCDRVGPAPAGLRRPVLRAAPALPVPDRHRRVGRRARPIAGSCWPGAATAGRRRDAGRGRAG